jgi:hypothetical protein
MQIAHTSAYKRVQARTNVCKTSQLTFMSIQSIDTNLSTLRCKHMINFIFSNKAGQNKTLGCLWGMALFGGKA